MAAQAQAAPRLIRRDEVLHKTGLSTSEIYRRIEAGTFPKQIRLGAKSVAWLEADIDQWILEQVEAAQ